MKYFKHCLIIYVIYNIYYNNNTLKLYYLTILKIDLMLFILLKHFFYFYNQYNFNHNLIL